MTTNVTDLNARQMACDSRWSLKRPTFVMLIDDAGFEKIVMYRHHAYMFAGNGRSIQAWKNWLSSKPSSPGGCPSVDHIAICIVNMPSSTLLFQRGQDSSPGVLFAGTGAKYARECWHKHFDAQKAVASATSHDIFSGGSVKYVRFDCGSNNLADTATISDVTNLMRQKGTVVMRGQANQGAPVMEAAANDSNVQALVEEIEAGVVVACAPCDSMDIPWSEDEVLRLHEALAKALQP